jgi:hypothetical protein
MGYGYNALAVPTSYYTVFVDDGKDSHDEEDNIVISESTSNERVFPINENCTAGNCTATANNTTVETNVSNVVNSFFDDLCAKYLDFSSGSAQDASIAMNESAQNIEQAKVLLNGSTDEQDLGQKYLQSSELKLQYAQDMLNLSREGLDDAKDRINSSQGNEEY